MGKDEERRGVPPQTRRPEKGSRGRCPGSRNTSRASLGGNHDNLLARASAAQVGWRGQGETAENFRRNRKDVSLRKVRGKSPDGAWFSDLVIWMGGSIINEGGERSGVRGGGIISFRGKITNMLPFSG